MMTLLCLLMFTAGVVACLARRSSDELLQASLLPFADDPHAAGAMTRATGLRCDQVLEVALLDA